MINRLPGYYRKSQIIKDLYEVIKTILDGAADKLDIEGLRLFITQTDEFEPHEDDVGLSPSSESSENRRSKVIARLQGNNLLTLAELRNLITNYEKSGCDIREDFPNYTVYITFSGRKGIPENMELIKAAIEEVKPAHLRIGYDYCENTWQDIWEKFGAWGNIAEHVTWDMLKYHNKDMVYLDENNIPYQSDKENAVIYFNNGQAYARRI